MLACKPGLKALPLQAPLFLEPPLVCFQALGVELAVLGRGRRTRPLAPRGQSF